MYLDRQEVLGKEFPFGDVYTMPILGADERMAYQDAMLARQLDEFHWRCFSLLHLNQIQGDYLEFGCGSTVSSFRLALKNYRYRCEIPRRLYAFDSFEGLPKPSSIDEGPAWAVEGGMAVSVEQFKGLLAEHGVSEDEYEIVPGFFDETLRRKHPRDYGIERVAFIHIDCDYYESARDALMFALQAVSDGAILSFDEWFAYNGRPDRGEQRAFHEAAEMFKDSLAFTEYMTFRFHGKSFIVHKADA